MHKKYFCLAVLATVFLLAGCFRDNPKNVPAPAELQPNDAFLYSVPEENFANLTLEDFPSIDPYSSLTNALVWQDKVFLLAHPFVVQYNFDGELVAYNNRNVLDCAQSMALVDDSLFVGCYGKGIYEIDLKGNQLVYKYDTQNGLEDLDNLELVADGGTLWAGTFNGLAKIDAKTHDVEFYEEELAIPGGKFSANVHARSGEVWATVIASAYSQGGAAKYDYETDKWTIYTADDFKDRDTSRIDFDQFIISDEGIFASFQDGGPDYETLKKFNPAKNSWELIHQIPWKEYDKEPLKDLPPLETYRSFRLNNVERAGWIVLESLDVYYGGIWKNVPAKLNKYQDIEKAGDSTYFLLSGRGLDMFGKGNSFPYEIAVSNNIFPNVTVPNDTPSHARLFITPENDYAVFFSAAFNEMGGTDSAYGIGVLDINEMKFFDARLEPIIKDDNLPALDAEKAELVRAGDQIELLFGETKFIIDLKQQKISASL